MIENGELSFSILSKKKAWIQHTVNFFVQVKHTKFNESGQLLSFYLVSLVWAGDIVVRENLLSIRSLWEGYPHTGMTFMFKFFYIVQIAYWLHVFPELYFQKIKREDMAPRVKYASLYLAFIVGAYVFNYNR